MNTITIPLDRRAVALMLPVAIRDRLTLYMRGRYEAHGPAKRAAVREEYLAATGRGTEWAIGMIVNGREWTGTEWALLPGVAS